MLSKSVIARLCRILGGTKSIPPKAIIAIARMLLTAVYHILAKREVYNPDLYAKMNLSVPSREITPEQAIILAQRQGFIVKVS